MAGRAAIRLKKILIVDDDSSIREILATQLGRRSEEHTSELQSHSDLVCRLLLEKKKTDDASIIMTASIVDSKGLPANSVHSATKAAVRSFARTWTTDLRDRSIRVNAISPRPTDT